MKWRVGGREWRVGGREWRVGGREWREGMEGRREGMEGRREGRREGMEGRREGRREGMEGRREGNGGKQKRGTGKEVYFMISTILKKGRSDLHPDQHPDGCHTCISSAKSLAALPISAELIPELFSSSSPTLFSSSSTAGVRTSHSPFSLRARASRSSNLGKGHTQLH